MTATTQDEQLLKVDVDKVAQSGTELPFSEALTSNSPAAVLSSAMTIYTLMPFEELAVAECRTVAWIECAILAGYVFSDGALTSPNHFRDWLRANPNFRARHYQLGGKHNYRGATKRQIYFIEAVGLDLIKIGMATDGGAARLRQLQPASPVELVLLAEVTGDAAMEARFHRQFASLRRQGEWFAVSPELRALIASLRETSRAELRAARALISIPSAP